MNSMPDTNSTVYIVIPVFNRVELTKECLNSLMAQTYAPLCPIVVDGGSTDGTPEYLREHYPQVVLLQGERELWWGGAMELGIDYCLRQSRRDDDMLLMMNNDSLVGQDYVETLVRVSRDRRAAVCGLIVDSRDASRILDAGECVDWQTYSFPVKTVVGPEETFFEEVDLLSGRGTLVPLSMVRKAGNVNAGRFPHYISDCEFFSRLKRHGFRLGVTYEAVLRSHVKETGLSTTEAPVLTLGEAWKALFSVRSMDNVRNHWRFIEDCAPAPFRSRLKRQLLRRSLYLVASRTMFRHVALPLAWFFSGTYYVTKQDCSACGCNADELLAAGVLKSWVRADWYVFEQGSADRIKDNQNLQRLYRRAWNPGTKVTRWMRAKCDGMALNDRRHNARQETGSPSLSRNANPAQTTKSPLL